VANVQQTDSVQQFLAYEKCYKITGGYDNCVAAHEPLSYSDNYPLTKDCGLARMARVWRNSPWHQANSHTSPNNCPAHEVRGQSSNIPYQAVGKTAAQSSGGGRVILWIDTQLSPL
jgi:hypothetical protein